MQGKGKKTVDVHQIEERLTSLKVVVDWQRVNRINTYRNDHIPPDLVVQVCQPRQKRLLAAAWMVKCFHHKQFPVNGIMRLICYRTLSEF
jgi:hypothetical protein